MKSSSVAIQMKADKKYFHVFLFVRMYKMVLTFESVDEILKCGHSNDHSSIACEQAQQWGKSTSPYIFFALFFSLLFLWPESLFTGHRILSKK